LPFRKGKHSLFAKHTIFSMSQLPRANKAMTSSRGHLTLFPWSTHYSKEQDTGLCDWVTQGARCPP
jgi:hypothetical protein